MRVCRSIKEVRLSTCMAHCRTSASMHLCSVRSKLHRGSNILEAQLRVPLFSTQVVDVKPSGVYALDYLTLPQCLSIGIVLTLKIV